MANAGSSAGTSHKTSGACVYGGGGPGPRGEKAEEAGGAERPITDARSLLTRRNRAGGSQPMATALQKCLGQKASLRPRVVRQRMRVDAYLGG